MAGSHEKLAVAWGPSTPAGWGDGRRDWRWGDGAPRGSRPRSGVDREGGERRGGVRGRVDRVWVGVRG